MTSYRLGGVPKGAPCDNELYRIGLICDPSDDECISCGWNPEVAKERYERTREARKEARNATKKT